MVRMASTSFTNKFVVLTKILAMENGDEKFMTKMSNYLVSIYQVKPWVAREDTTENQGQQSTKGIHSFNTQV